MWRTDRFERAAGAPQSPPHMKRILSFGQAPSSFAESWLRDWSRPRPVTTDSGGSGQGSSDHRLGRIGARLDCGLPEQNNKLKIGVVLEAARSLV